MSRLANHTHLSTQNHRLSALGRYSECRQGSKLNFEAALNINSPRGTQVNNTEPENEGSCNYRKKKIITK